MQAAALACEMVLYSFHAVINRPVPVLNECHLDCLLDGVRFKSSDLRLAATLN